MANDEADLIGMGLQHDAGGGWIRAFEDSPSITVRVGFHAVGNRSGVFDPEFLSITFPSGGAWRGQQVEEVFCFHKE